MLELSPQHLEPITQLLTLAWPTRRVSKSSVARVLFGRVDGCWRGVWGLLRGEELLGLVAVLARGRDGFIQLLAVHPDEQNRGVGSRLLKYGEGRLVSQGVRALRVEGSAPTYFRPGIRVEDKRSQGFVRHHGYRAVEERRSLRVPLSALNLDAPLLDPDIVVQRADPDRLATLLVMISETFSDTWAAEARLAALDDPSALHMASFRGQPVGFAASGLGGPDVFGPMGTLPSHRGRGIGRALLFAALSDIRGRHCPDALIAWIGPEEYYRRYLPDCRRVDYLVFEKA